MLKPAINHHSINEFSTKIDRLIERIHRGIKQYDYIEERNYSIEKHFSILNESIQKLTRLIEVSFLILISSNKEKLTWLQIINNKNFQLTNSIIKRFIYRLESYLNRSITDNNEKQAYIQALLFLQSSSSSSFVHSGFLLNNKTNINN